jgi:ribosomal-protein-alanine N-acetyltransferase
MTEKYQTIERVSELNSETLFSLKALDKNFFPTPWDNESWDQVLSGPALRTIIVLEVSDQVIGFALFENSYVDSFAHLLKILINPEFRVKGMGKGLLNEALRILRDRGIKNFFLEVEEGNVSAIKIYESAGFKTVHKKKHFYSNGASALIMTLEV